MLKTRTKLIITFITIVFAMILFNTSVAKATDEEINVIVPDLIAENLFYEITTGNESVSFNADPFELYNLSQNTTLLNSLVDSNGDIIQKTYIEIPENIDEVIDTTTNTTYTIVEIEGSNYIEYNLAVLTKNGNNYYPDFYWKILYLQYKSNDEVVEEKNIRVNYYQTEAIGYGAYLYTVDDDGNRIGSEIDKLYGGMNSAWLGGSESDFTTACDYSDGYYNLYLTVNAGSTIEVGELGTFSYVGLKYSDDLEKELYLYTKKITDTSLFTKAQTKDLIFTIVDSSTGKGSFNEITMNVTGETRQTYSTNDETTGIGISLNGATEVGVSLQVDNIDEANEIYVEMTNQIGNTDNYIWIGAYDINLVGGDYEGDLILTFDVGTDNNGRNVIIYHKKSDGTFETFLETVVDGKVTITVTELSPFLLAYVENSSTDGNTSTTTEETRNNETTEELDNTPKTGTINNIAIYGSVLLVITVAGVILIKRK